MDTLHLVALWVRRATWAVVAVALMVAVTLAMFAAGRYSAEPRDLTLTPSQAPDLVARVVADVEATGLACSTVPSLALRIVFERLDGVVEIVSFDDALVLAEAGSGWVRSYCSPIAAVPNAVPVPSGAPA